MSAGEDQADVESVLAGDVSRFARYRDALVLFYFHGMDVAAAARSLGLPEGTVKARLSRGRAILRGKLPRFLGTPRLKEA